VFADGRKFSRTRMRGNITVNSIHAIRQLVQDGLGVHLGPAWVFREALGQGEVRRLLPAHPLLGACC